MSPASGSPLVEALKDDRDWKTKFRTVAEWLDAVDDLDYGPLAAAADELRRRAQ